ncbi:MAG: hypothetical protein CMD18_05600 [Flavobacteriales bacterium]|nr:hypothetical protein [Flavobacteriales bacterium]|tara:strand:+ start:839 stop:1534 length:696 start_codon:yes stop_codon:yes gene_type:complete
MRNIYLNITFIVFVLFLNKTNAQTVWNGPIIEFVKQNNADPANTANQDIITSSVALTRGSNGEIYNANLESIYQKGTSPLGTEWAIGDLSEIESLTFSTFRTTVGKPKNVVGKKLVLHITDENVYLSVEFTSWSQGKLGGFAYKRSTNNETTSAKENISKEKISIFPNPCTDYIQAAGIDQVQHYEIFDVVGSKIVQGTLEKNKRIEIKYYKKGIYFLRLENGKTIRFLKK